MQDGEEGLGIINGFSDAMNEFQNMTLNQGSFLNRDSAAFAGPPHSPHKLQRANKLRRYEESKASINIQNVKSDASELERNFSPINSQKTFVV